MPSSVCRCPNGRCNDLAKLYLAGEKTIAGNEVVRLYQPLVVGIVKRVLGPSRAAEWADAIQDAFFHGLSKIPEWRNQCPFCCFLGMVVARRCIDIVRHLDRDRHVPLAETDVPDRQRTPLDQEFRTKYDQALEGFSTEYREAWQLHMEMLTAALIAERQGVSERTVYNRLHFVRSQLAKLLGEFG